MEAMTDTAADAVRNGSRSEEICEAVVTAVAAAKGVDTLDLEPLYSVVDPDALNSMFRHSETTSSTTMELRFEMEGCQVIVRDGGEVTVTPLAESEGSSTAVTRCDG